MNLFKLVDGIEVEMSDAEQSEYDANQAAWVEGAQARLLSSLATHRYSVVNGGTTINGIAIQTDETSRSDIIAAFIMATANPNYSIQWKTPNGFVTLGSAAIISLAGAVAAFVQKAFATEASLITNISQYSDSTSIAAAFDKGMMS